MFTYFFIFSGLHFARFSFALFSVCSLFSIVFVVVVVILDFSS